MGRFARRYMILSWALVPLALGIICAEVLRPTEGQATLLLFALTGAASLVGLLASIYVLYISGWEWPSLQAGVAAVMTGALLRNVAIFADRSLDWPLLTSLSDVMAYTGTFLYCFFCLFLFVGVTPWGRRRALLKTNYDPRFWKKPAPKRPPYGDGPGQIDRRAK